MPVQIRHHHQWDSAVWLSFTAQRVWSSVFSLRWIWCVCESGATEDVYLYRMFLHSSMMVVHALSRGLFHMWHSTVCHAHLSSETFKRCFQAKALNEASHSQVGQIIFHQQIDNHLHKYHNIKSSEQIWLLFKDNYEIWTFIFNDKLLFVLELKSCFTAEIQFVSYFFKSLTRTKPNDISITYKKKTDQHLNLLIKQNWLTLKLIEQNWPIFQSITRTKWPIFKSLNRTKPTNNSIYN